MTYLDGGRKINPNLKKAVFCIRPFPFRQVTSNYSLAGKQIGYSLPYAYLLRVTCAASYICF